MVRPLIIGTAEREAIAALIGKAATRVTPIRQVMRIAQARLRSARNPLNDDMTLLIPTGFQVTYTHEEQPRCTCRHISISLVAAPDRGPHPAAVQMLLDEFGFKNRLEELPFYVTQDDGGTTIIDVLEPLDGDVDRLKAPVQYQS